MNKTKNIAIDGPSGAGKSTLAKMLAKELGFIYVDTGAIYRSVGLYAIKHKISSKDEKELEKSLNDIKIEMRYDKNGIQRMILNGEDVTDQIRTPEASIYASDVSAMPSVRKYLLDMQRKMADEHDVIMDGRDIGTVVLPNADVKIFLTASAEIRADRRFKEFTEKKIDTTYEEVLKDQLYRDKNDSSRAVAPLRPAEDSVILDTSDCDLKASLDLMKTIVEEKLS